MGLTPEQHATLMRPLRSTRVAKRQQGGKTLSYLESYDVKAHLIRIFGFANFDSETIAETFMGTREYKSSDKPMVEVIWHARHRLTLRDPDGNTLATFTEGAVGSASGPANMLGEHHDNALKTAASDALKRCAINLGSQFGLSLYDNGSLKEVVRTTLVQPPQPPESEQDDQADEPTEEQAEKLQQSVGAVQATEEPTNEAEQADQPEATHGAHPQQSDEAAPVR
jgi:recombination DNA repair RAD52 pathway protein